MFPFQCLLNLVLKFFSLTVFIFDFFTHTVFYKYLSKKRQKKSLQYYGLYKEINFTPNLKENRTSE